MDDKLLLRIDSLLKHIDQVLKDTNGMSEKELEESNLLLRATCFSIAQIGETMNHLEDSLSAKYDRLPWVGARRMRNVIVHDYGNADVKQIYSTIQMDLPKLKRSFLAVRNDLITNTLLTGRLILRHIRENDVKAIYENWASNPNVTRYVTWQTHKNIEETQQIVDRWLNEYKNPKTIRYGITLKGEDKLIGAIDVVNYVDNKPEIGYCLSEKYWNKGYMTEACNSLVNYLFDIGYDTVIIRANENNIASNKVIQKCGFDFDRKESMQIDSEQLTINCYKKTNQNLK